MREARNTFYSGFYEKGEFTLKNGVIDLRGSYRDGIYVYLSGGRNDGIYMLHKSGEEYVLENTVDDVFAGTVFALAVPPDFLELVRDIEAFIQNMPDSGFVSERFGEYSYTRQKEDGSWENIFALRVNKYKKMRDELLDMLNGGEAYSVG
jgi:hypothetical protein